MSMFGSRAFAAPLAALALMAGSSVALAANDGALPGQGKPDGVVTGKPTGLPTLAPEPTETPTPEPTPEPTETPTTAPDDGAAPTPSLVGLCHAYEAGGYANSTRNGRVNPAWTALETAAGGSGNLATFCTAKLAEEKAAADEATDEVDEPKPVKPKKAEKPVKAEKAEKPEKPEKPEKEKKAQKPKKN
jgi:hypothetical protein